MYNLQVKYNYVKYNKDEFEELIMGKPPWTAIQEKLLQSYRPYFIQYK